MSSMRNDASPPNRPSRLAVVRRAAAERRFPTPFRILWWVGAFLPTVLIVCELIGILKIRDYRFINPLSTLIGALAYWLKISPALVP